METSCLGETEQTKTFPVEQLLTFPAALPCPFLIHLYAVLPQLRGREHINTCFDWSACIPRHLGKAEGQNCTCSSFSEGHLSQVLLLHAAFTKLPKTVWFWDLNLSMRLKLALLGVRQRGKSWWECISFASFGNPGYSTIKSVLASIYVNYESS